MKHQIKFFKNTLLTVLLALGMGFSAEAQYTCTVSGIVITATGTSNTTTAAGTNYNVGACYPDYVLTALRWTGTTATGVLTYTFSQPITTVNLSYSHVNGNDIGTIAINGGGTLTLSNPCNAIINGNILIGASGILSNTMTAGLTVSSTLPFTSITLTNSGSNTGFVQGNLCGFTFTPGCNAGTAAPNLIKQ